MGRWFSPSISLVKKIRHPAFHSITDLFQGLQRHVLLSQFHPVLAYKNAKDTFTLPGLGKLVLVDRKARIGRNPATGETIQIKAKKVVKFRVAKAAKDAILGAK